MNRTLCALLGAMMALACVAAPAAGRERGLKVDDVVALEAFGRATISPDGRWAVYEKRGPYDSATRFDLGQRAVWTIMDLWRVDLEQPDAVPERLLPGEGPGLLRGGWSPSGDRLLVHRFTGDRLEIGIVTVADRSVRWTGLTPEMPQMGAASQWVDDATVVLMTRRDGDLPWLLRYYGASQVATSDAWRRTAAGDGPARTVIDAEARRVWAGRPAGDQRLVRLDVVSGETRSLFEGQLVDFAVSPDGQRVALIEGVAPRPLPGGVISQSDVPWVQRLALIDANDGRPVRVSSAFEPAPHLLRWSADSRAFLVWGRSGDAAWAAGDLRSVQRDGTVTVIGRHGLDAAPPGRPIDMLSGVRADWLGPVPILLAGRADGRRDWYALPPDGEPRVLTSALRAPPDQLAAITADGAEIIADGAGLTLDLTGARRITAPDGGLRAATAYDVELPFRLRANDPPRRAWTIASGPTGLSVLTPSGLTGFGAGAEAGEGALALLAGSPSAMVALRRTGLSEALVVLRPGGEQSLDRVNAGLADHDLPTPVPLDHPDVEGRLTHSWLFLPATPARGIVVLPYPGSTTRGAWAGPLNLTYGIRPALLVGQGYAVLSPSIPGADYGDDPGDYFTRSVDLAMDAALARYPDLPGDRAALLGHSFGGYAALAIAARSSRYRAYIAWAASTDLFGAWGEFTPVSRVLPEEGVMMLNQQGWVETGQAGLGAPPFDAWPRYARASPYLTADRIRDPVLLIAGDRDFVPISQAERLFSALSRTGGRVRLVTYWGEEHFNWSPPNIRDVYAQIFDWLETWVASPASEGPGTEPTGPCPEPSLKGGGPDERAEAALPHQGVLRQRRLGFGAVDDACVGEQAVEQPGPQNGKAGHDHPAVDPGHVAL